MYFKSVERGMSPDTFWSLSHKEVIDYIRARDSKSQREIRRQAQLNHRLAIMIAEGNNGKLKTIDRYFEGLFEEDEIKKRQEWKKDKANILRFLENK